MGEQGGNTDVGQKVISPPRLLRVPTGGWGWPKNRGRLRSRPNNYPIIQRTSVLCSHSFGNDQECRLNNSQTHLQTSTELLPRPRSCGVVKFVVRVEIWLPSHDRQHQQTFLDSQVIDSGVAWLKMCKPVGRSRRFDEKSLELKNNTSRDVRCSYWTLGEVLWTFERLHWTKSSHIHRRPHSNLVRGDVQQMSSEGCQVDWGL